MVAWDGRGVGRRNYWTWFPRYFLHPSPLLPLPSMEVLGNLCPSVAQFLVQLVYEPVLFLGPGRLFYLWVQVVVPPLPALLPGPAFQMLGDEGPSLGAILHHQLLDFVILLAKQKWKQNDVHFKQAINTRVPTKIGKQDSMTFPWLICFFPWLPFSHGFRYGYDCVSQHARQSQTRKLPQPWEEAIPWLSMTFWEIFSYSKAFPWQQFFPGFSTTIGILNTTVDPYLISDHS